MIKEAKELAADIHKLAHGFGYPSRIADIETLIASKLAEHRARLLEYMDICETLSRELAKEKTNSQTLLAERDELKRRLFSFGVSTINRDPLSHIKSGKVT